MRGTTDGDLTAFHEIDASLARVHADVAAAAQDCFGAALHDFDVHGALHGDGFAVDGADRVIGRLVSAHRRRNQQRGCREQECRGRDRLPNEDADFTPSEILRGPYTIR